MGGYINHESIGHQKRYTFSKSKLKMKEVKKNKFRVNEGHLRFVTSNGKGIKNYF